MLTKILSQYKDVFLKKSKDEIIEILLLVWTFIHVYIYFLSIEYTVYNNGYESPEFWFFGDDLFVYDISELFLYTMSPILIYYIYKKYFKL